MGREIIQVDENTWRIEDEFVRYFLLQGTERALLIDSGVSGPDAKDIASKLTNLPLSLLNTHGDGDHTAGNGAFSEFYMHPEDYRNCRIAEKFPESKLIPISDGDEIDLGGRVLKLYVFPGHTRGSVAILDVNSRVLISGDIVQNEHIFMFGAHRAPESFADSLEKMQILAGFDVLYPSHGDAVLPKDYIQKVLHSWKEVQDGKIGYHEVDMHGTTVRSYDGEHCGFFCENK